MTLLEKAKNNWLIALLISWVFVGAAAWSICLHLLVGPRDFEIMTLRSRVGELSTDIRSGGRLNVVNDHYSLVVLDAGISEGQTVVTTDGALAIKPEKITENGIAFTGVLLVTNNVLRVARLDVGQEMKIMTKGGIHVPGFKIEIKVLRLQAVKLMLSSGGSLERKR